MRTINYSLNITFLILALATQVFCQSLDDAYRGHTSNDFYFVNTTFSQLSYITDDGQNIELKNSKAFRNNQYVADTAPGKIYSLYNSGITESNDYGKTFNMLSQSWMNADTGIFAIKGGEIGGLYYIGATCSDKSILYLKTSDYFSNVEPINYYPMEVGFTPGEFYRGYATDSNIFLTHTMNSGISYDTICISDTIVNDYFLFYKLSRGSVSGELFLVTMLPAVNWYYRLYHSTDYGATWVEKNIPSGVYDAYFTAGRGNCKFYIVNVSWYGEPNYKLDIYASDDCGETYTKYTHELPTFLGLAERKSSSSSMICMPNPAIGHTSIKCNLTKSSSISIAVFNAQGTCVVRSAPEWQQAGEFVKTIDLTGLVAGLHSVQILADGKTIAASKLIIAR